MAARRVDVERPLKRSEHRIQFATREAEKGWQDLLATARNATVDAWDFLTRTPTLEGGRCYRLQGSLGVVIVDGQAHERWQYKPTSGGRIWYAVVAAGKTEKLAGYVMLERVEPGHPNQTVKQHR